jgi:hypothetical protein
MALDILGVGFSLRAPLRLSTAHNSASNPPEQPEEWDIIIHRGLRRVSGRLKGAFASNLGKSFLGVEVLGFTGAICGVALRIGDLSAEFSGRHVGLATVLFAIVPKWELLAGVGIGIRIARQERNEGIEILVVHPLFATKEVLDRDSKCQDKVNHCLLLNDVLEFSRLGGCTFACTVNGHMDPNLLSQIP